MVEHPAGGNERLVQDGEVVVDARGADVLSHPDRADRIEPLVTELAVVLQADVHLVAHTGLADTLPGQLGLLAADRDADRLGPIAGRGVDHHRTPSTSDVEQPHPLALVEPELAGDEVVLRRLSIVERHVVVHEAGARVGHRLAEHDPVEVVADVVVVADRPRVTAQRMPSTLQPHLLRRRGRRPSDHPGALRCRDGLDDGPPPKAEVLGAGVAQDLDDGDEVALGIDLTGDVGPAEPELVGLPQHPANGIQ